MRLLLQSLKLSGESLNGKLFTFPSTPLRLSCARSVSVLPSKRYMKEEKFAQKDKVPDGFKIIYRAPMETYVKVSKLVSGATAAFVGGLALFKFATDRRFIELSGDLDLGGLVAHESDIWMFAGGFVAINAAIMYFISKYPLRIYKNEKKYMAIYEGFLPFQLNRYSFNQGEVKALNHVLNPWSYITYRIGTKSSLLLLDYFKTPSEFHQMCEENK